MRIIIAGGREFELAPKHWEFLDTLVDLLVTGAGKRVELVMTGGAQGADRGAAEWAQSRGFPLRIFPADWQAHGKAAGPRRNRMMARFAGPGGLCILFPGGKGTHSMKLEAGREGLQIVEITPEPESPPCPSGIRTQAQGEPKQP